MIKSFIILLFCLLLYSFPSLAQEPDQPVQLELELDSDKTYAEVFALPDSSLILYTKTNEGWLTEATFGFSKYDHQLRKVWQTAQKIDGESEYVEHYTEAPFTYFIFDSEDEQEYYFVKINLTTGESTLTEHEIPDIRSIEEFKVLEGNYFFTGTGRKSHKPALYHLDPKTGKVTLLPSVYGDESFFADLLADSEQNRTDAVLLESNGRVSHLQTKSFSPSGELIGTYFTPPQRNKLLQDAEISPGDTLSKLLIGVYGSSSMKYSSGFFTMPLINSREGHFYSILDLENSLKHLNPRQENRIRRREQKREAQGREPRLNYNLLLHDVITTPDQYILAAEVYTTQFFKNNITSKPYIGIPTNLRDDAYKHNQVIVAVFDKQGKLMWDNTFRLDDIVTDLLVPTVEVAAAPDGRVIIALPDDNDEIIYHIMEQDTYTKDETTFKIKGPKEGDKISWTSDHGIISWYGANFAAFGFHRVTSAERDTRNVFYINKISF